MSVSAQLRAARHSGSVVSDGVMAMSREWLMGIAVPDAAQVSGACADAVVAVDLVEHVRRTDLGMGAVGDRGVLHALMCLPLGAAIPVDDLDQVTRDLLRRAPAGCVEWLDVDRVRRRVQPVAQVPLVVVRAATWRSGHRRANAFEPFAPRVVVLSRAPRRVEEIAWEADADGIGLWIFRPGGEIDEVVAPASYSCRYVKPAGWLFGEAAYGAWLAGRRPHTVTADVIATLR